MKGFLDGLEIIKELKTWKALCVIKRSRVLKGPDVHEVGRYHDGY